jgi:hypothetical protein
MQKILAVVVVVISSFITGFWFHRGLEIHSTAPLKKAAKHVQVFLQNPVVENGIFYTAGLSAGIWFGMRIERRKR